MTRPSQSVHIVDLSPLEAHPSALSELLLASADFSHDERVEYAESHAFVSPTDSHGDHDGHPELGREPLTHYSSFRKT